MARRCQASGRWWQWQGDGWRGYGRADRARCCCSERGGGGQRSVCEAERRIEERKGALSPVLAGSRAGPLRNPEYGRSDPLAPHWLPQSTVQQPRSRGTTLCADLTGAAASQSFDYDISMNANMEPADQSACLPSRFARAKTLSWRVFNAYPCMPLQFNTCTTQRTVAHASYA